MDTALSRTPWHPHRTCCNILLSTIGKDKKPNVSEDIRESNPLTRTTSRRVSLKQDRCTCTTGVLESAICKDSLHTDTVRKPLRTVVQFENPLERDTTWKTYQIVIRGKGLTQRWYEVMNALRCETGQQTLSNMTQEKGSWSDDSRITISSILLQLEGLYETETEWLTHFWDDTGVGEQQVR